MTIDIIAVFKTADFFSELQSIALSKYYDYANCLSFNYRNLHYTV